MTNANFKNELKQAIFNAIAYGDGRLLSLIINHDTTALADSLKAEWSKQPFTSFSNENEEQLAYRWFDEKADEIITKLNNNAL